MEDETATRKEDLNPTSYPPPRFVNLDAIQPVYANYVHILPDQYAFHLIFSQIAPSVIRTDEDREAVVKDGLAAQVVSRLIVTPSALRDIIAYMSDQLDFFEANQREVEVEHDWRSHGL